MHGGPGQLGLAQGGEQVPEPLRLAPPDLGEKAEVSGQGAAGGDVGDGLQGQFVEKGPGFQLLVMAFAPDDRSLGAGTQVEGEALPGEIGRPQHRALVVAHPRVDGHPRPVLAPVPGHGLRWGGPAQVQGAAGEVAHEGKEFGGDLAAPQVVPRHTRQHGGVDQPGRLAAAAGKPAGQGEQEGPVGQGGGAALVDQVHQRKAGPGAHAGKLLEVRAQLPGHQGEGILSPRGWRERSSFQLM